MYGTPIIMVHRAVSRLGVDVYSRSSFAKGAKMIGYVVEVEKKGARFAAASGTPCTKL
jgi:hypothetical protein